MNFKIIETDSLLPNVLLHRSRTEDCKESVDIIAFGQQKDIEDFIATEIIVFEDKESAINFITDYSVTSANKWCEKQDIKY